MPGGQSSASRGSWLTGVRVDGATGGGGRGLFVCNAVCSTVPPSDGTGDGGLVKHTVGWGGKKKKKKKIAASFRGWGWCREVPRDFVGGGFIACEE